MRAPRVCGALCRLEPVYRFEGGSVTPVPGGAAATSSSWTLVGRRSTVVARRLTWATISSIMLVELKLGPISTRSRSRCSVSVSSKPSESPAADTPSGPTPAQSLAPTVATSSSPRGAAPPTRLRAGRKPGPRRPAQRPPADARDRRPRRSPLPSPPPRPGGPPLLPGPRPPCAPVASNLL